MVLATAFLYYLISVNRFDIVSCIWVSSCAFLSTFLLSLFIKYLVKNTNEKSALDLPENAKANVSTRHPFGKLVVIGMSFLCALIAILSFSTDEMNRTLLITAVIQLVWDILVNQSVYILIKMFWARKKRDCEKVMGGDSGDNSPETIRPEMCTSHEHMVDSAKRNIFHENLCLSIQQP